MFSFADIKYGQNEHQNITYWFMKMKYKKRLRGDFKHLSR